MATGEIAVPTFQSVLSGPDEVIGLFTQPDRPVGRKQILTAPEVKTIAGDHGVPVFQPESVRKPEPLEMIRELQPEVIVVMAYGQILPQALIEIPSRAIINLHGSLLPKYRGASCIQGALLQGDEETGWSVIHVVKKLDAGNVLLQQAFGILEGETGGELHDRLAEAGPAACKAALNLLREGPVEGVPQDEAQQTYVPKLNRDDGLLDWSQSADGLERMIRAYHPWPGTYTYLGKKRLKLFPQTKVVQGGGQPGEVRFLEGGEVLVCCGEGALVLGEVQLEGSRRVSAAEAARGHREAFEGGLK